MMTEMTDEAYLGWDGESETRGPWVPASLNAD